MILHTLAPFLAAHHHAAEAREYLAGRMSPREVAHWLAWALRHGMHSPVD